MITRAIHIKTNIGGKPAIKTKVEAGIESLFNLDRTINGLTNKGLVKNSQTPRPITRPSKMVLTSGYG